MFFKYRNQEVHILNFVRVWVNWYKNQKYISRLDNIDNMDKVKIQLDKDIVNKLLKLKEVGDTYSDVVRRLLK